jgi:hypothetical protein
MARKEAWREAARCRYWREAEARAVIKAWRLSGETLAGFCRAHGVARARLTRWIARLGRPAPAPVPFLPVRVTETAATGAEIEVDVPGGVTVRLGPGFDTDELRRVLSVLGVGPQC